MQRCGTRLPDASAHCAERVVRASTNTFERALIDRSGYAQTRRLDAPLDHQSFERSGSADVGCWRANVELLIGLAGVARSRRRLVLAL
jgi:hypothetical protein